MCAYDPALPSPTYFTLGDAIAALAFTLAVQPFLRPVYRLRLAVLHLTLGRLYTLIFIAVGLLVLAALVPSFTILHGGWWGYPIVYELAATFLFIGAYGAVALAVARPVRIGRRRLETFVGGVAQILAEGKESDHVDLIPDLLANLPHLVELAVFIERPPRETSAFWMFIHREKVHRAQFAVSLLRILSDPHFCRSIVIRAPWAVGTLLNDLAARKLYARAAEALVQELALQAILLEDSIMTREIEFSGFREAPFLSESLFSLPFIVTRYDPLQNRLHGDLISAAVLRKFNKAAVRCYTCLIEEKQFTRAQVTFSIERFYESAGLRAWSLHEANSVGGDFAIEFGRAVDNTIALARKLMAAADEDTYNQMFVTDKKEYRHDPLEPLTEIVFNAWGHISKGFGGLPDPFWSLAIGSIGEAFNSIGEAPDGMTPFQQRLTLKIVDQLDYNMNGYYPAISRVLLATVGPYHRRALQPNMTAFNILRNAMYAKLKRVPGLASQEPEKLNHFLPPAVVYDAQGQTLTHTYSDGAQAVTDLKELAPVDIDLLDAKHHRPLSAKERDAARRTIY